MAGSIAPSSSVSSAETSVFSSRCSRSARGRASASRSWWSSACQPAHKHIASFHLEAERALELDREHGIVTVAAKVGVSTQFVGKYILGVERQHNVRLAQPESLALIAGGSGYADRPVLNDVAPSTVSIAPAR